jgi:hypothetical protein
MTDSVLNLPLLRRVLKQIDDYPETFAPEFLHERMRDRGNAMTEPVPNLPLLRSVLKQIDDHPETWYQCAYMNECGTAFCVAVHAALMTGARLIRIFGNTFLSNVCELSDGTRHKIGEYAIEQLGITNHEAWGEYGIFEAINDRQDIQEAAERIAARAGETL